jgi:hypothetical protein
MAEVDVKHLLAVEDAGEVDVSHACLGELGLDLGIDEVVLPPQPRVLLDLGQVGDVGRADKGDGLQHADELAATRLDDQPGVDPIVRQVAGDEVGLAGVDVAIVGVVIGSIAAGELADQAGDRREDLAGPRAVGTVRPQLLADLGFLAGRIEGQVLPATTLIATALSNDFIPPCSCPAP